MARCIRSNTVRTVEFATFRPISMPRKQEIARSVKLLNVVQIGVPDIHIIREINRHASGPLKVTVTIAISTPLQQEVARRIELLNVISRHINHIDVTQGIHGDAPRILKLAVPAAAFAPLQ